MSQTASRNAAFLEEMGVGAHWTLRRAALAQQEAPAEQHMQSESVAAAEVMPAAVAAAEATSPAAASPVAPAAVSDDAFAAALADAVSTPYKAAPKLSAVVAAPQSVESSAGDTPAVAQARADIADASPAVARAVTPPPATPEPSDASAAADDSTAWFDDAPTPARPAPVSDEAIATMDWPALKTAIATCTRCDLCATRRGVVPGRGAVDAQWMAIGAGPGRLDEKESRAIAGDAGQLLDNMLKAIALAPERDVYLTNLVKCRPSSADGADRAPTPDEVAACRPYLERELALTGAAMLVTLGRHAAKGLLGAAARGEVQRYGELPVVATYHPDDLLRRPEDKAKAWGDLCLARAARDNAA